MVTAPVEGAGRALAGAPEISGYAHAEFLAELPVVYLQRTPAADLRAHYLNLAHRRHQRGGSSAFHQRGSRGELIILPRELPRLRAELLAAEATTPAEQLLIRVAAAGESFLVVRCWDWADSARLGTFAPPQWSELAARFVDDQGWLTRHLIIEHAAEAGGSRLDLLCVGSHHETILRNSFEILAAADLRPTFFELYGLPVAARGVERLARIEIHFAEPLPDLEVASLSNDFERYLHPAIRPRSLFDLIGPAMVGPSSSHTAGANRIGRLARQLLEGWLASGAFSAIEQIRVKLLGSFRDTGVGHKTPPAVGGGLCGLAADDGQMLAAGEPQRLASGGLRLAGQAVPFGGYQRGSAEDDARYAREGNANVVEIIAETDRGPFVITGFSVGGGNVEIRFLNHHKLATFITGQQRLGLRGVEVFAVDPSGPGDADGNAADGNAAATAELAPLDHDGPEAAAVRLPFDTLEELEDYVSAREQTLIDVILACEATDRGLDAEVVYQRMAALWQRMRAAVRLGLTDTRRSPLGLTGGDAEKLAGFLAATPLFDNLAGRAVAYATAASEVNAKGGVIVACPTAGACGLLPGLLVAYEELRAPYERRLCEALMVAGFMGMILFDDVTTAGADYGCQAEVGAGAAMAAAALAYLEGGDAGQVIAAFTLAIKNCMGLVCDPVAGLVEVPCVKRNGVYAGVAVSAAAMALAGLRSFVSPDEVVLAVREVGEKLNRDYKETAGGGLAQTRDGKSVERRLAAEVRRFFGDEG